MFFLYSNILVNYVNIQTNVQIFMNDCDMFVIVSLRMSLSYYNILAVMLTYTIRVTVTHIELLL